MALLHRGSRRAALAVAVLSLLPAPACAQTTTEASAPRPRLAGIAPRELRAAWVATVGNIDWPSRPGLPVARQQAELRAILDRAAELRLNALVFQVRPMCDALYPSKLEPWSEWLTGRQGRAPEPLWDPLQFAIDGAHARGLELHAWFNPFRARHAKAHSPLAPNHVARRLGAAVVHYGNQLWLDPADPRARRHTLRVMMDVVERYDVDGIHIDDYFYPYPDKKAAFPDQAEYHSYRVRGGKLERAAWRRAQVDRFVEELYEGIKQRKPWVKLGISPFGIARPGLPAGIAAGIDQFDDLYADPRKWLREGWCDYMAPQLYWPIAQKAQSYPVLLRWWTEQNPLHRHLWPGNYASKAASGAKGWSAGELVRQIELTRSRSGAGGNILFSMQALMPDHGLGAALRKGPYSGPALVPASPWLDDDPPDAPRVVWREHGRGGTASWGADSDARWWAVYDAGTDGRWRLTDVLPPGRTELTIEIVGRHMARLAVTAVDRCGNQSRPGVVTLR